MAVKFPIRPGHPERICWGCEHFCPADDMRCGNGTDRAQHPMELWGKDWMSIGFDETPAQQTGSGQPAPSTTGVASASPIHLARTGGIGAPEISSTTTDSASIAAIDRRRPI